MSVDQRQPDAVATVTAQIDIAAAQERIQAIWDQLLPQCLTGPLPFVQVNAKDPNEVLSTWNVADTGNEIDDFARGFCYAQFLVHRVKAMKGKSAYEPFEAIYEVMLGLAEKGDIGPTARGFLFRVSMITLAGSLN
jgi:hypothetical protein